MNSSFIKTTFTYKSDAQWKFKHAIAYKSQKMGRVMSTMVDRYIEDFEDERMKDKLKPIPDGCLIEWKTFKRRMGLDELQDHDRCGNR